MFFGEATNLLHELGSDGDEAEGAARRLEDDGRDVHRFQEAGAQRRNVAGLEQDHLAGNSRQHTRRR